LRKANGAKVYELEARTPSGTVALKVVIKPSLLAPDKQVVELVVTETDTKGLPLPPGTTIDDSFGLLDIVLRKAGQLKASFTANPNLSGGNHGKGMC
jgi:hypothetical protein